MILYHFTARHLVPSILKTGLDRGAAPHMVGLKTHLHHGIVWLSDDKSRGSQGWDSGILVKYSRTDARLEIEVDDGDRNLYRWEEFYRSRALAAPPHFAEFGNSGSWFIYDGKIGPERIRSINYKKLSKRRGRADGSLPGP